MRIVSRAEWKARPARSRHTIATPTGDLYLHHTAGALDENGNGVWWDDMQAIQRFHMDGRGWTDIAYSFLVGGGQVFEGRGVGIAGGHTKGHNSTSHAICLIGNYDWMKPTSQDLVAIADLVAHGAAHGWWPGRITGGHRDVGQTACPGSNLYDAIPSINRMVADRGPSMEDLMALFKDEGSARTWFVQNAFRVLLGRDPSLTDIKDRSKQIEDRGAAWVWHEVANSKEAKDRLKAGK